MPFNVADGRCRNCEDGKTAFCTGVNPGFAGGAYGSSHTLMSRGVDADAYRIRRYGTLPRRCVYLRSWTIKPPLSNNHNAGQAQYLRVPYADFNALKLPAGTENEADFILLAGNPTQPAPHSCLKHQDKAKQHSTDIFPTGWHGIEISGFQPGDSVAVFGAGPVGLMAAYSAQLRGASRVFVVDRVPERLRAAERIGAIAVDFTAGDAVDQIISGNGGEMVDRSVDAVGYQAVGNDNSTEVPNIVLENMIRVTRACGGLGIPGLYVPRFVSLYYLIYGILLTFDKNKATPVLVTLLLQRG